MQEEWDDVTGREEHHGDNEDSAKDEVYYRRTSLCSVPSQNRGDHHHRDDDQILEDQDPERCPAMGAAHLLPVNQDLHHDGCRGERDQHPDEYRLVQVPAGKYHQGCADQDC